MKRIAALIALCMLTSGCYTTTVSSGLPPASQPTMDETWHSSLLDGLIELDSPRRLDLICPKGWAKIQTKVTFLNGFLATLSGYGGLYEAKSTSVWCADPSQVPAPAAAPADEAIPATREAAPPPPAATSPN